MVSYMSKTLAWLSLSLMIFFVQCTRKPVVNTNLHPSEDSIKLSELKKFASKDFLPEYFQFKCKVDFNSPKMNENFSIHGRLKRDSIIWLSITPGLGIEVVRCLIRKDSVFVLDRINNGFTAYSFDYINKMFQTQLSYNHLEALLLGNVPYAKELTDKLVKQEKEDYYLLRQLRGVQKIDNYILATPLRLRNLEALNTGDRTFLSVSYENFSPLDSVMFANTVKTVIKTIDAAQSEKTITLDLQFTKTEISAKPLNFPFNVPRRFENK
jgi:hypothetical protein